MSIAAWARGWAAAARTTTSRARAHVTARTALAWDDLVGTGALMPDRILYAPPDLLPPDADRGRAMLTGTYTFDSQTVRVPEGTTPWSVTEPSPYWAMDLNSFDWLRDLEGLERETAGEQARWLVNGWLHDKGRWDRIAWRPDVAAQRIVSWCRHGRLILEGADLIWRSTFLRSLSRQSVYLHKTAHLAPDGEPRLRAAVGLALSGLCLPHGAKRRERGVSLVLEEVARQILPDGGHVSRDPDTLLRVLMDLMTLLAGLDKTRAGRPESLQHAVDRMAPMVRFFRHGDGSLAAFNGARRRPAVHVDAVLAQDDTAGKPLRRAMQSGYQRLARGGTVAIMDTGAPSRGVMSSRAHSGCLSLELSAGHTRMIVNCGTTNAHGPTWREALRATAAHSTVTIGDTSSSSFLTSALLPAIGDGRIVNGPVHVSSSRTDNDSGTLVDASHDGYMERFGMIHRRRLYVSADGRDVRGEDTIAKLGEGGRRPQAAAARFHLHPDVIAQKGGDGATVHLTLPDQARWRFRTTGGTLALEESAYLDETDTTRQTRQIVLSRPLDGSTITLKWAVQAVDDPVGGYEDDDAEDLLQNQDLALEEDSQDYPGYGAGDGQPEPARADLPTDDRDDEGYGTSREAHASPDHPGPVRAATGPRDSIRPFAGRPSSGRPNTDRPNADRPGTDRPPSRRAEPGRPTEVRPRRDREPEQPDEDVPAWAAAAEARSKAWAARRKDRTEE